jgi:hypothetical protein
MRVTVQVVLHADDDTQTAVADAVLLQTLFTHLGITTIQPAAA